MTSLDVQGMEQCIREYIGACNAADPGRIAACFVAGASHYFPHKAKWKGASTIAENFVRAVRELGISWAVDRLHSIVT